MRRVVSVLHVPGLYKATGEYARCWGITHPVVQVDPQIAQFDGEQAYVQHELCHARRRHRLRSTSLLAIAFGVGCLGILFAGAGLVLEAGLVLLLGGILFLSWLVLLRDQEIEADQHAIEVAGEEAFVAFVWGVGAQPGWWGRWMYGASCEDRIRRADRR